MKFSDIDNKLKFSELHLKIKAYLFRTLQKYYPCYTFLLEYNFLHDLESKQTLNLYLIDEERKAQFGTRKKLKKENSEEKWNENFFLEE